MHRGDPHLIYAVPVLWRGVGPNQGLSLSTTVSTSGSGSITGAAGAVPSHGNIAPIEIPKSAVRKEGVRGVMGHWLMGMHLAPPARRKGK